MGYLNPLLKLPAGRALLALPAEDRSRIEAVMRELRDQANTEAENAWKRRKGPMAAYWRAVSTYARHIAHAVSSSANLPPRDGISDSPPGGSTADEASARNSHTDGSPEARK